MNTTPIKLVALVAAISMAALGAATTVGAAGSKSGARKAKVLKANLRGKAEVPGPGDPDGKGKAAIRINANKGRLCFRLSWRRIAEPNKAHIHLGAKGVAGDIVVTLFDGTPVRRDCVENLNEDLLRQIKRNPRQYYVNVHNADFPAGAIRGQLKRSGRRRGNR